MGFFNWEVATAKPQPGEESYIAPESLLQDGGLAGACIAAVASPLPQDECVSLLLLLFFFMFLPLTVVVVRPCILYVIGLAWLGSLK